MLTAVEVHVFRGDIHKTISFPLAASVGGPRYVVKNIDGLGPTKAEIVLTTFAGMPGASFQTANIEPRNILVQLGFNPDYVSDDPFGELRRALYGYLSPGMEVELHFISDFMDDVKTVGRVESAEPSIFSPDPMITVSVVCPDPYFYALETLSFTRNQSGTIDFTNPGDAQFTGFVTRINGISAVGETQIFMTGVLPYQLDGNYLDYHGPTYVMGEQLVLEFDSTPGQKSAGWMFQYDYHPESDDWVGFEGTDLLGYVDSWPYLIPGHNRFTMFLPGGLYLPGDVTIEFTPKYVGL